MNKEEIEILNSPEAELVLRECLGLTKIKSGGQKSLSLHRQAEICRKEREKLT